MNLDLIECEQCGSKAKPEIAWLGNCGVPWKVIAWCKICKAGASGKTLEEALSRFKVGQFEVEAR